MDGALSIQSTATVISAVFPAKSVNTNVCSPFSVNVYVSAPTDDAPRIASICPIVISSPSFTTSFRARWVIDQNRNSTVNPEHNADMQLIISACVSFDGAKMANSREIIMNNGAPGGCPTCKPTEVVINSPQSHRLAVGSAVRIYVRLAMRKTTQPAKRFTNLKSNFG